MSIYSGNTLAPGDRPDTDAIPQKYHVSASTHEGKVRRFNEDNFALNKIVGLQEGSSRSLRGNGMKAPLVCSVFDGTGGEAAGVAAARMAADNAVWLYDNLQQSPYDRDRLVTQFVKESNDSIVQKLYSYGGRRGASTFVLAIISNAKLYTYSLGDSRLYLYTGGTLYRVTNDHTVAMDMYRQGFYTRDQADRSPERHKLTAFLGSGNASIVKPEKYDAINLSIGDRLLLCSDGLYSALRDYEISEILGSNEADKACVLIDSAVEHGAKDNVTAMVIECAE